MMESFSVLLSLYFRENPQFLKESLESIFSQSLLPSEVILVEDGELTSELDSIVSIFKNKYDVLKIIKLKQNVGLGKALNEGLKYCSNDLVIRMDADDISKPNRFERLVNFMMENPGIDVCSSWIDEFQGSPENIVSIKKLPENHDQIYLYGKSRCPVNHPAAIFRKKAIKEAGGYGNFPEDYNLWARMLMKGYKFHNLQESLLWFRMSPEVYKRRGGIKYLQALIKLYMELYKIGYINKMEFIKLVTIRSFVSLMPNFVRSSIYHKLLRTSPY